MATAEMPAWQRGFALEDLKARAALFADHDAGLLYGAFTKVSEQAIAEALEQERFAEAPGAAAIWQRVQQRQPWRDFSRFARAHMEPGDLFIKRLAFAEPAAGEALVESLLERLAIPASGEALSLFAEQPPPRAWLQILAESAADRALAERLGFRYVGTKIPASSELFALYYRGPAPTLLPAEPAEQVGLCDFGLRFDPAEAAAEVAALEGRFAQHYSSKNKRASWAALGLTAFGPASEPPSAEFIAKPAEMAKKWKAENAEKMEWTCRRTELWYDLPKCAALAEWAAAELGAEGYERVRLMRLAPGGGELARHADITDVEAGVMDGRLCRVHMPLKTSEGVVFEQWLLDGSKQQGSMPAGAVCALDMRKPHTAVNGGEEERIHLVVDCWSSAGLRAALEAAKPL